MYFTSKTQRLSCSRQQLAKIAKNVGLCKKNNIQNFVVIYLKKQRRDGACPVSTLKF